MAIAYRSQDGTADSAAVTSASVTKPSGTANNDILALAIFTEGDPGTMVLPSGFSTKISQIESSTGGFLTVGWKRAGGSEPASYSITWDNNCRYVAAMLAFSGGLTSGDPTDVYGSNEGNYDTGTPLSVAELTPNYANTCVVAFAVATSSTGAVGSISDADGNITFTNVTGYGGKGAPTMTPAYSIESGTFAFIAAVLSSGNSTGAIGAFNFQEGASAFTYTPIAVIAISCS